MRFAVAVLLAVMWVLPVSALDPARAITQYSHRMWQDELPQNSIHTVVQTSDGYIWFGTYEGLVRFDGVRFVVFDAERSGDLLGSTVLHLEEDREGRLWISTNQGLTILEHGLFRSLTVADGLPGNFVIATAQAMDGSTWISTSAGLCRMVDGVVREFDLTGGDGEPLVVRAMEVEKDGAVWMATDAGLILLDNGAVTRFTQADGLPGAPCRFLELARDGALWVGTDDGLWRRVNDRFEPVIRHNGLPSNTIRALYEDNRGVLWIGTEVAGLIRFANDRFDVFDASSGLSHNYVRSITEDREGSLWVGTNGGFNQFRDAKFISYSTREGLSSDYTRTVFEDGDGVIWIGNDGGGLDRLEHGRITGFSTAEGLANNSVRSIAQSDDGTLWIGTRGGLSRFANGRFTTYSTGVGLSSPLVRVVYVCRDQTMWVGTENGLNRWKNGSFEVLTTADGLAGNDVRALFEDSEGRLWIGTFGGVSCLDKGRLTSYRIEDGLSSSIVLSFFEDSESGLWIGSDSGLNLLKDGVITVFYRDVGLFDDKYFSILADDFGHVWVSSNRGIARFSLAGLRKLGSGRSARIEALAFDRGDGMRTNQCNGASQPAGWKAANGHLWFPTARGVVKVEPGNLRLNPVPPPVLIEEVFAEGMPLDWRSETVVPAGAENFEFHYTALSFAAPDRVNFRYRLHGSDRDWVDVGTRRVAYYSHLPPGRYTFEVIACNEDGVWNDRGASFSFELDRALWQTWWARLVVVILVLSVIAGSVRYRVRALARRAEMLEAMVVERTAELDDKNVELSEKVKQLEASERNAHLSERRALEASRAKSVFLSNMSHELRTPLNSIIGFASILKQKLVDLNAEERSLKFIDNIYGSGQHLLSLINDILDLSKIEAGRMEVNVESFEIGPVLEDVRRVMQGMSHRKDIAIEIGLTDGLPRIMADRSKLKQVLFNLMSNAVKFSPGGSLVETRATLVDAEESPLETTTLRIDVSDQGVGIAKHQQELIFEEFRQIDGSARRQYEGTGLGLALVRRLIEMQGGKVLVESVVDKGSTFTVLLPQVVEAEEAG